MEQTAEKVCAVCKVPKPISDFYQRSGKCKTCIAAERREWRKQNPDKLRESRERYYETHKQQILDYSKRRYEENKDRILAQVAGYREKNRESIKLWMRQYRKDNPEKHKETHLKSVTKNADRIRERERERRKRPEVLRGILANKRLRIARKNDLPNRFTQQDWDRAISYFGGCCAVCGRPPGLWHTLARDHWIPLSNPSCPGTIPGNIIPLCHGVDGCNNSKASRQPGEWLTESYGAEKAALILAGIEAYFRSIAGD